MRSTIRFTLPALLLSFGGAASALAGQQMQPVPLATTLATGALKAGPSISSISNPAFGVQGYNFGTITALTESHYSGPNGLQVASAAADAVSGGPVDWGKITDKVTYYVAALCGNCQAGQLVSLSITSTVQASFDLHGISPAIHPDVPGGPYVAAEVDFGDPNSGGTVLNRVQLDLLSGLSLQNSGGASSNHNPAYDGTAYGAVNDTSIVQVLANTYYEVDLSVAIAVGTGESGIASADPVITLMPGQSLPGPVTLDFSVAVPEPTALALLGAGLLGLAGTRRRR
jgi:hypothetical protein